MAVKLASMTEAQIGSNVEAFADYQYEGGEQGLFYLFPDKEAVRAYMSAFVRAGVRMGWMYATSEKREAYIMISDSKSSPSVPVLLEFIKGGLKAFGFRGCISYIKALRSGGKSLESRMKKDKKDFIKIELLAVTKPCQGQGYMRKALDIAFRMGQDRKLPCILDTDGSLKRDKYIHLGMKPAGTRKIGKNSYLYDLVKPAAEE